MFTPFENLSIHARVWIYQSSRNFTVAEKTVIDTELQQFTSKWEAHQQPLNASYQVLHNRFIVLAVDENYTAASGCSIDKSTEVIRKLSTALQIDLFDRLSVNYLSKGEWLSCKASELKNKINLGEFTPQTMVFNTLAQTKKDLETKMLVPAEETWLKKYFVPVA
jgi:hypothetical protein